MLTQTREDQRCLSLLDVMEKTSGNKASFLEFWQLNKNLFWSKHESNNYHKYIKLQEDFAFARDYFYIWTLTGILVPKLFCCVKTITVCLKAVNL